MIASMLTLSFKEVAKARIYDEYAIHRTVYDLFPGSNREFLFYKFPYPGRKGIKILLLSVSQPQIPSFGKIESKRVPQEFLEHQYYAFKVKLNPVVRSGQKTSAITGYEPLITWFTEKQENWGFIANPSRLELSEMGAYKIDKSGTNLTFNQCTYSGVLEVIDQGRFIKGFEKGIGRGQGFGFGLLQLRPLT